MSLVLQLKTFSKFALLQYVQVYYYVYPPFIIIITTTCLGTSTRLYFLYVHGAYMYVQVLLVLCHHKKSEPSLAFKKTLIFFLFFFFLYTTVLYCILQVLYESIRVDYLPPTATIRRNKIIINSSTKSKAS
jgi:hypothetical protein